MKQAKKRKNWLVLGVLAALPALAWAMPGVAPIVQDSNGMRRPAESGDTLQGQGGGIISFGHLPPYGAKLSYVSATSVSLGTASEDSQVSDSTGAFAFKWNGLLTAVITASGKDGLDTGAEAASTFYAVFAIADTSGTNSPASLLSLSETSPTLPAGYDVFKRLGWTRNDSSSNFLEFLQIWNGITRRLVYDEAAAVTRVINNGAATTYTDLDLSAFVPPSSLNVLLDRRFSTGAGGAAGDSLYLRPDGFGGGSLWRFCPGVLTPNKAMGFVEIPCPGQIIEYKGDQSANRTTISVSGYDDEL